MPLHLLGKKSWNVYNKDNIERVRRDEATAAAHEEAQEQRMQELDAARRTAILRGDTPPPLPLRSPSPASGAHARDRKPDHDKRPSHDRKRRRLRGEDETDREIRFAREDAVTAEEARATLSTRPTNDHDARDAPLVDRAGHISLFPAPDARGGRKGEKNAEAEAEKARKQRALEDQYTMRFANAAGFKQGLQAPWYAGPTGQDVGVVAAVEEQQPGKDVWGNADPRRKGRESARASANDPMAFMRKAQTQLKQAGRDRERWKESRQREMEEVEAAQRRRRKASRRSRERGAGLNGMEGLDGFSLDAEASREESRRHRSSKDDRHRDSKSGQHRRRSRSRSPR